MTHHPFDLLMELDTQLIRLDYAALHLARDIYPHISPGRYIRQLDALADEVAALRPGLAANLRYEAMRQVLIEHHEFVGNEDDYYAPENAYINHVLDTKHGSPITLAIVWIEIGRRLKWPVSGVGLPGHFIIRFDDAERYILASPYLDGRTLAKEDCRVLVRDAFDDKVEFSEEQLDPVDTRQILLRMLHNLRNIYLARNELDRVAAVLRRMAAVEPRNGRHLQDLAAVCCRQGNVRDACSHLEMSLRRLPEGEARTLAKRNLRQLRAALRALN